MKLPKLDKIDLSILRTLQGDGRLANVDLADRVGLSPTPCLERVRRLEAAGYIDSYHASISANKMGLNLLAFVEVSLDKTNPDAFEKFRTIALTIPEIQECHMVAGGFDYLLKVRMRDMPDYRRFLGGTLSTLPGVDRTHTYVVMEEVKSTQAITIPASA